MNPFRSATPADFLDFTIKCSSYCLAALFLLLPLQNMATCVAALIAVPAAIAVSKLAQHYKLRLVAVVAAAAITLLLGCLASTILGGPTFLSRWVGPTQMLTLIGVVTFGLWTLAIVFLFRTLAERRPVFVLGECLLLAGAAVYFFFGHHEYRLDQPRIVSDWALSRGYDPRLVLRIIGIATMGFAGLLLLRPRGLGKSAGALGLLALLLLVAFQISFTIFPDYVRPAVHAKETGENGPRKADQFVGPLPPQQPDNSPSFNPTDWPKSPKPMAIATLHDDFAPPGDVFHFREAVYSEFNGRKLIQSHDPQTDPDVPRDFPTAKQTFDLPPLVEKLQRIVPLTISQIVPHPSPITLANVRSFEPQSNARPGVFVRTDAMEAQVLTSGFMVVEMLSRGAGDPKWSAEQREYYTRGPADPRYKELAEKILAENPLPRLRDDLRDSPVLKMLAIRRWLETNATYWLQAEHHQADDPVASFLFGDRQGFCVHVAHAMVYLSRSLGLPTRAAGGYAVSAAQAGNSSGILMNEANRHLWCELYVEGLGWVVIDAALEKSRSEDPPQVDQAVQDFFNESNRPQFDPEPPQEPLVSISATMPLVLFAALLVVAALYAVKVWRRYAPHWASPQVLYRVGYRAVIDRLAEVGIAREFGETREEFAQRVATWAPEFADLSEVHVRQALTGGENFPRWTWLIWIRQIEARIQATKHPARRLAGCLHPFSWLAAK